MAVPDEVTEKRMRLRYAGRCRLCGATLAARTEAVYERDAKTVRCVACPSPPQPPSQELDVADEVVETPASSIEADARPAPESGTAGASARREFERRQARREERIRTEHPKLGDAGAAALGAALQARHKTRRSLYL